MRDDGVGDAVVRGVVAVAEGSTVTVCWKQEQALETLGRANSLTKFGRATKPSGSARKGGQNKIASTVKRSKALRTLSAKQTVEIGVGGAVVGGLVAEELVVDGITPTVSWKHEHALLTLGRANSLTKLGRTTKPRGSAKKGGRIR